MMSLIKIVVATENKQRAEIISRELSASNKISVAAAVCSGTELVAKVMEHKPEVIISELMIPQKDGISAYNEIKSLCAGSAPDIFIISSFVSESVNREAMDAGIAQIILEPFDMDMLVDKIITHEMTKQMNAANRVSPEIALEFQVTHMLHDVGVPAHINGYQYLRRAIMMAVEDMSKIASITKTLYPDVAKSFDTTSSRVERAMRHAIEVAWDRGSVDMLNKYFGYTVSSMKGKPTNSEFISMIADRVRLQRKLG